MGALDQDLRVVERRMQAVSAVRQVVQALCALARAQLPLAEAATAGASEYLDCVDRLVNRLAGPAGANPAEQSLFVVLGPERAYCGGLARRILEQVPDSAPLVLVGKRCIEQAQSQPALAARCRFTMPGAATHDEVEGAAEALARLLLDHAGSAQVELFYPWGGTSSLHHSVLLAGPRRLELDPPDTFSNLAVVLDAAVREAIMGRLAVGLAETLRSEVRARISAAEQARTAADKKLELLRQQWRAARQEQITSELLEVVAGRQATLARSVN